MQYQMKSKSSIQQFQTLLQKLQNLGSSTNQKLEAWENEIRDLQDKTQLKQFKIDKFEGSLSHERLQKSQSQAELTKYRKEIDSLFKGLQRFGYKPDKSFEPEDLIGSDIMKEAMVALSNL